MSTFLAAVTASVALAAGHARPVPILMYHVIGVHPPGAPNAELYVTPSDFRAEVGWLARRGYQAVTLDQVYRYWRRGTPLPARPIVLTFDDGYPGDIDVALPVLRQRRWPGVLNLQIGNLAPARVRKLIAAGWEIDAHTFTHPDLTGVDAARLKHEVAGARTWIRGVFHLPVDFFCYPAGRYNDRVVAAVRAAGYLGATTTNYGLARPDSLYTLDRVRVNGSDGIRGLASKLAALAH
ncbi:MAG: polysaccharide deacetylase family protein [Gaiellaceae bacterium]